MKNNNIEEKIGKAVAKYSSGAIGIILFGSAARGGFDKYSDIDLYVLREKKPDYSRENITIDGIRVDVIIDGTEDANSFLEKERKSVRRNFAHMLAHGRIVFAKGDKIEALQKKAIKFLKEKTKIDKDTILMHLYSIEDFGFIDDNAKTALLII